MGIGGISGYEPTQLGSRSVCHAAASETGVFCSCCSKPCRLQHSQPAGRQTMQAGQLLPAHQLITTGCLLQVCHKSHCISTTELAGSYHDALFAFAACCCLRCCWFAVVCDLDLPCHHLKQRRVAVDALEQPLPAESTDNQRINLPGEGPVSFEHVARHPNSC